VINEGSTSSRGMAMGWMQNSQSGCVGILYIYIESSLCNTTV
jgi:hypothetical protein